MRIEQVSFSVARQPEFQHQHEQRRRPRKFHFAGNLFFLLAAELSGSCNVELIADVIVDADAWAYGWRQTTEGRVRPWGYSDPYSTELVA
jgi:hypothetical protein